jgi:hypothetical protein
MAQLTNTFVTGKVSATVAASGPQDYVRQQELTTALGGKAAVSHTHLAANITDLDTAVPLLLAGELAATDSVGLVLSSGALAGFSVRLQPSGGLLSGAQGLYLDASAVSLPGHHHQVADIVDFAAGVGAELGLLLEASDSIAWTGLAPSVRLKTNGALLSGADGLSVDLGAGATQAAPGNHTHSQLHNPLTLAGSATLTLALNGQQLSAEVLLGALGGLAINSGVVIDFGTEHYQAARGDHTHPELGGPLTVASTASLALLLDGNNLLSGVVRCDPAPGSGKAAISIGGNGLFLQLGSTPDTAAAGDHGHATATHDDNGFMSAADKAALDALVAGTLTFNAPLSLSGNAVSIAAATTTARGTMSAADKAKLDALALTPPQQQIYAYTGESPTADGIVPTDPTKAAIAYKLDGTGPLLGWNTATRAWN